MIQSLDRGEIVDIQGTYLLKQEIRCGEKVMLIILQGFMKFLCFHFLKLGKEFFCPVKDILRDSG